MLDPFLDNVGPGVMSSMSESCDSSPESVGGRGMAGGRLCGKSFLGNFATGPSEDLGSRRNVKIGDKARPRPATKQAVRAQSAKTGTRPNGTTQSVVSISSRHTLCKEDSTPCKIFSASSALFQHLI